MAPSFRARLHDAARKARATIILAEPEDDRVLEAAGLIERRRLAKLLLLGDERVSSRARRRGLKAAVLNPATHPRRERYAKELVLLRRHRGLILEGARELLNQKAYFSAMLVRHGEADGFIAGSLTPSALTLRAALHVIGTREGFASSYFIILHEGRPYFFADCAFNIEPTPEQLALIARQTARSAREYGLSPRVAFLSFSTHGSARHERVERVRIAVRIARRRLRAPLDGELQFDAAFDPGVARRKAPGSSVAGRANVFIFPDLDSANIAYKIAERMGGAEAIGPVIQGLRRPANDLSRGCTVREIVDLVAITAFQAGRERPGKA